MSEPVVIREHLYLTEDRSRVVKEGDPDGRWLWASPGMEVTQAEAERLGLLKAPELEPEPEPASEPKARQSRPADKQRRPAANKAKE